MTDRKYPHFNIFSTMIVVGLVSGLFGSGCGLFVDLDETEFESLSVPDTGSDASSSPDLPTGMTCPAPNEGDLSGECDPVTQNCRDGAVCTFRADAAAGTLIAGCVLEDEDTAVEGAPCSGNNANCGKGLFCVNVCVRFCERASGLGCRPDQRCTPFDAANSVGRCSDMCTNVGN